MKPAGLLCTMACCLAIASCAMAAPFANLDFEDATLPGDPLPGWSVNNLGPIYNLACLGSSCVSVHDAGTILASSDIPLEGDLSVFLQAGYSGDSGALPLIPAAIAQTGDVPVGAQSIRLLSTTPDGVDPIVSYENLLVSIAGSDVPLVPISTSGNVVTLGGNVGVHAGTTSELVISTKTPVDSGPELWAWVDAVSFSTVPIPEPSSVMLMLAGVLIGGNVWRRR